MNEQAQSIHIVGVVYPDAYVDALQLAIANGGAPQSSEVGMVALFVLAKPTDHQVSFTGGASFIQNSREATSIHQVVSRRNVSPAHEAAAARVVSTTLARARSAAAAKQEQGWSVWVPRSEEVKVGHTAVALVFEHQAAMDIAHQRAHEMQREQRAGEASTRAAEQVPVTAADSPAPAPTIRRHPDSSSQAVA